MKISKSKTPVSGTPTPAAPAIETQISETSAAETSTPESPASATSAAEPSTQQPSTPETPVAEPPTPVPPVSEPSGPETPEALPGTASSGKPKKKKKKFGITDVIFLLLLIAGLSIFLYPTVSDWFTRWQLSRQVAAYNKVAEAEKADYSEMWEAAEEYNRFVLTKESQFIMSDEENELIPTLLNPLGTGMMGYIDIPSISVHLPIYQEATEKELQSGAGWWKGSSLPTGGPSTHCIITAHTGLAKAKFFTDIDQLEPGDTFTISVLDRVMNYEVDQIVIATPEDASELYVREGEDHVTLYTCYPYGVNTHRLLVRGTRIEETEDGALVEQAQDTSWADKLVLIVAAIICLLLLLLLIILWIMSRKKRKKEKEARKKKLTEKKKNKNKKETQNHTKDVSE